VPDHPVFARLYSLLAALGQQGRLAGWRAATLAEARGLLLVVGLGPGHDLARLPAAVSEVVAVEPDRSMHRAARRRVATATRPVHLVAAAGEHLPLPAKSVDAVLLAFVLCTVDEPETLLAEVDRVLRPDGTLHVLEHVRAPDGSRAARWQDLVAPLWHGCASGCHPNRRTRALLAAAGFDTSQLIDQPWPVVPIVSPYLRGVAKRKRDEALCGQPPRPLARPIC